jgi:hypothetical protein
MPLTLTPSTFLSTSQVIMASEARLVHKSHIFPYPGSTCTLIGVPGRLLQAIAGLAVSMGNTRAENPTTIQRDFFTLLLPSSALHQPSRTLPAGAYSWNQPGALVPTHHAAKPSPIFRQPQVPSTSQAPSMQSFASEHPPTECRQQHPTLRLCGQGVEREQIASSHCLTQLPMQRLKTPMALHLQWQIR